MDKKQISTIIDLCLEINGLQSREKEKTGNLPTAFFSFYGHTDELCVKVHEEGWKPDCKSEKRYSLYTDKRTNKFEFEECVLYLEKLKRETEEKLAKQ